MCRIKQAYWQLHCMNDDLSLLFLVLSFVRDNSTLDQYQKTKDRYLFTCYRMTV